VLVLAATAIVAAMGVSLYRTQQVRAQIEASIVELEPAQDLVAASFEITGVPPLDAPAIGVDETMRRFLAATYVDSFKIHNGRIDVRFGARAARVIAGQTLSLTPYETADRRIVWICGNETPGVGLNPLGFAGGTAQATQGTTSIEDRFLPPVCR
jgi:hypothetical protein